MSNDVKKVSQFRRFLPQVIASTVKNFLLLDLGLSIAFPGIIIPALTGFSNENNKNEFLSLTATQASWLGSIAYICQPIGSIISGWITDPLGRKRAMLIVNIPHVIAWFMMYKANSVWMIFVANTLLGLGVGLMEAPILTYVGEICEPSIRGILVACANVCVTLGLFIVYFLNTIMPWRQAGLICFCVPLLTMVAVCFIPETPLWLLSKNRTDDAKQALQWLRGWVPKGNVANEFEELKRYSERSRSCNLCMKRNEICSHPDATTKEKMAELIRKRTLKPFIIVISLFFLSQFTGISAMRPYIVQIFKAYKTPVQADYAAVLLSFFGNIANIFFICFVRFTGKRRIYLFGLAGVCICSLTVSLYGFSCLPFGYTSFNKTLDEPVGDSVGYIPLIFLMLWNFFSYCGVLSLPWMLLSEIFPFKYTILFIISRGMATGTSAATNYLIAFVATKTYYNLETMLSIPGVTLLYSIIGFIGFFFMYRILPETENKTLEDIELHFSDNTKKITDRKINKTLKDSVRVNNNIGCDNNGFTMETVKH